MNKRCGNGGSSGELDGVQDTTEIANKIVARIERVVICLKKERVESKMKPMFLGDSTRFVYS